MATIENKSTLFHWNKIQSGITTDFEEVAPILTQGSILAGNPANDGMPVAVTSTDIGKILKIISDDNGGVKVSWESQEAGHSQNTDIGTSNSTFYIGVNGPRIKKVVTGLSVIQSASEMLVGFDVGDLTTETAKAGSELSPFMASADNDLITKKKLDAEILAGFTANDAMVFKGSIGAGGVITSADTAINNKVFGSTFSYEAGWVFLVDVAQTVPSGGFVCDAGDKLWCVTPNNTPFAYNAAHWRVTEGNIVGAVSAEADLISGRIIVGNGTKKVSALGAPSSSPANKVLISNAIGKAEWSSTVKYENPMTAAGDIVIGGADGAATRLAKGNDGAVLKLVSGVPAWGEGSSYTHPTTPGNIHLPAGGAVKQMLQWSDAGTAKWIDVSGDVTVADGGATVIGDQKVGFNKIVNSAAAGLSVLGRYIGGAGSFSEIAALYDGDVMQRAGNTLKFGRIFTKSLVLNETAFNFAVEEGFVGQVIVTKDWLYRCHTTGIGADKWKRIPFASFTI